MRKIKVLGFLAVLFALGFGLSSCGDSEIKGLKTEGELVIGLECAYQPFNWTETTASDTNVAITDMSGSYAAGYDIEIAKLIAAEMGLTLKVKAIEWDGLIPALKAGSIDAIIAGMSPTETRKKSISFTDKYYESQHVMLVKVGSGLETATSLDDFEGKTVAGQLGTIYADLEDQIVTNNGAKAGTKKSTVNEILLDMNAGATDAQILELPVAMGIVAQNPDTYTYVSFAEGKGFTVSEEDKVVSIGVRKNFELLDEMNAALAKISEETRTALMSAAVLANTAA